MADIDIVAQRVEELIRLVPDPEATPAWEILRLQYDLGLAWVHFAPGYGGLGEPAGRQHWVDEQLRLADLPESLGDYIGLHQAATAIHLVGTDTQKQRFLRPIFSGEEHWCQLFSEPGAGSDLAGLSTSAVPDGDAWIVNGQKVWTSSASRARWGILLARTDPRLPKHKGLSFFVCDMSSSGTVIRPIRQADGDSHFSEVFLTDVRIPDSLRLGAVGAGWAISMASLDTERDSTSDQFHSPVEQLLELWQECSDESLPGYAARRDMVVQAWIDSKVLDLTEARMSTSLGTQGADSMGAIRKIAGSEHTQRLSRVMLAVMGAAGQVDINYDFHEGEVDGLRSPQELAIRSTAMTIEGGTNEILRNVLAERVLGLPREIRTDKDRPWIDVPRN